MARQVAVGATEIAFYEWSGRTIEFHRAQIRKALGFREGSVADAEALAEWLVRNVTQSERSGERVREQLMARCRDKRIEPPTSGRIDRIIRSALSNLLFRLAEATVDARDKLMRDAAYPVASRTVLADLVAEFKSSGPTYQRTVKATLKASYTNHYRAGMIKLLSVLKFRSNNTTHRPVLDALQLIARYANAGNLCDYPAGETVPVHRGIAGEWEALVYANDAHHRQRVVRMVYEVCTFQALREQLRCKEIWVVGADRWRNPTSSGATVATPSRSVQLAANAAKS